MKKVLFFTIALVVSALAFVACNGNKGNEPESQTVDPKDVTVKDLIGEWRVDSTYFNNEIDRSSPFLMKSVIFPSETN